MKDSTKEPSGGNATEVTGDNWWGQQLAARHGVCWYTGQLRGSQGP